MKTWTTKEIRRVLKMSVDDVKGKAVSDADRAYRRGWRDCVRGLRLHFEDSQFAAQHENLPKEK